MKGITLTQPWASLIAGGAKTIETRSWRTPHRGPLAIHAAKGLGGIFPGAGEEDLDILCMADDWREAIWPGGAPDAERPSAELPRGAIVATCELVAIVPTSDALAFDFIEDERLFGNYEDGRWAWVLADVRAVKPPVEIPKGLVTDYRGVWQVPPGVLDLLRTTEPVPVAAAEARSSGTPSRPSGGGHG